MPVLNVHILDDGKESPFPQDKEQDIIHVLNPIDVCILQGGMESGAPSIAIRIQLPDKTVVYVETSLGLWNIASSAFKGACSRWGVKWTAT
jgi:hypothetical protein